MNEADVTENPAFFTGRCRCGPAKVSGESSVTQQIIERGFVDENKRSGIDRKRGICMRNSSSAQVALHRTIDRRSVSRTAGRSESVRHPHSIRHRAGATLGNNSIRAPAGRVARANFVMPGYQSRDNCHSALLGGRAGNFFRPRSLGEASNSSIRNVLRPSSPRHPPRTLASASVEHPGSNWPNLRAKLSQSSDSARFIALKKIRGPELQYWRPF